MPPYIPGICTAKSGFPMFSRNEKQARRLAFLFCGIQFQISVFAGSLRLQCIVDGIPNDVQFFYVQQLSSLPCDFENGAGISHSIVHIFAPKCRIIKEYLRKYHTNICPAFCVSFPLKSRL